MDSKNIETINRKKAASGKISYGDPVVVHETSVSRVTFVPYYIPHSDHTELSVKIVTWGKLKEEWKFKEEKTITLSESASRHLQATLAQHYEVAKSNEDGKYLLLRINDGTADLSDHDPQLVANALTKALSQKDIVKHLHQTELSDELINSLRGAIRVKEMQHAVSELQNNLDSDINDENTYQEWCQNHSWAFGSAYIVNDEVRNISASDNLDMLLPTVIAGYRDLVELKRPNMQVLNYDNSHRNYYWTSDVSKAIGQCHRYLDILHEVAANGLRDHPEIVAYHPRAIIVIGRSSDWDETKLRALHGLNHRLSSVSVMTYDQLLAQGERLLHMVIPNGDAVDQDNEETEWNENIPF
tara:strand:+ start:5475 stop:6542 length:1068 start_codon:yes stop_codon:yes gene_type:complete